MSGKDIAVALIAGANASKNIDTPAAVRDRWNALRRAVMKRSDKIPITSFDDKDGLAAKLDEHQAMEDRAIVTCARELLMLIKLEDQARRSVEAMWDDVEAAHTSLSGVNLDEQSERAASSRKLSEGKLPSVSPKVVLPAATPPPRSTLTSKPKAEQLLETERGRSDPKPVSQSTAPPAPKSEPKPESTKPALEAPVAPVPPPPKTSRRFAPPDEPSKTELERTALPIWQRTEHFFAKAGALILAYIIAFCIYWFFIRTNDAMEKCRAGEAPRCWEVVAVQDTVDQGKKVQIEPLQLLCDKYNDPCGCAGAAYLKAAESSSSTADCSELQHASQLDPAWPCTCTRYGFWRYGKDRTATCGIARCD